MTYTARDDGCIATVRLPNGKLITRHRGGDTTGALAAIIAETQPLYVECVSTPRTILRDLGYPPRRRSQRKRRSNGADPYAAPMPEVDPWAVERSLLGRLDRLDLLPPRMRQAPFRSLPLRRPGGA